jgi:hypothetical protein
MPRSEAQIAASQANGAKSRGPVTPEGKRASAANCAHSTGPRTPEGKARSSRNATRHAILAHSLTLQGEVEEAFIELLDIYKQRFRPLDEVEERAVETMVNAEWRRRRLWTFEVACTAYAALLQKASGDELAEQQLNRYPQMQYALAFGKMSTDGRTVDLICRYESLVRREYTRARAELDDLQADRRRREKEQLADMDASLDNDEFISIEFETPEAEQTEPEPVCPEHETLETKQTEPEPAPDTKRTEPDDGDTT